MIRPVAIFLILALAAAPASAQTFGVPNTSNAPPAGAPVQIEDCKAGQTGGMLLAQSDGNFQIVFTNEGATTADLIRFQIELAQERIFIRDAGKFSPGVTIKHTYRRRGGNVISSPLLSPVVLHCSVAAVHFIDGTDWTANAASAVSPSGTAGDPPALLGDGYLGVMFKQGADGVYASLVMPASPAAKAGIRQGDRIANIASNNIATLSDALQLISATPPGTKLRLVVMRNGQPVQLTAIVGKRPARVRQ